MSIGKQWEDLVDTGALHDTHGKSVQHASPLLLFNY